MKNLFRVLLCLSIIAFTASAKGQKNKQTSTVVSSTTKTKTVTTAVTQVVDNVEWDATPKLTVTGNFMTVQFTKPPSGVAGGYVLYTKYDDCSLAINSALSYATIFNSCYYQSSQAQCLTASYSPCEASPVLYNVYYPFSMFPGKVWTFRLSAAFITANSNGASVQYSKEFTK